MKSASAEQQGLKMKKSVKSPVGSPKPSTASKSITARKPLVLPDPTSWTFLTNHTHVLLSLFRQSDQRLRDVATAVGITERMVQRIVAELVDAGYLQITKEGRCNRYTVNAKLQLRHPLETQHTIGELLAILN
ncbi:helix-turn-helix domain-containing protein [Schlesneria paludicola]|uniref:hypothetical protein n=1 Tax=Schlesneria paludicola TaxID=360056 RepID=UPI00029A7B6D|nr:hypothetical protein [Schlesneria paludicola]